MCPVSTDGICGLLKKSDLPIVVYFTNVFIFAGKFTKIEILKTFGLRCIY